MGVFVLLLLIVSGATAQSVPGNRLTFSGGWSRQVGGYFFQAKQTATGLGLSWGYRAHRYIEPEAGLFTALNPTGEICGRFGCVDVNDHFFWIPFGVRFVAPPYLGRIEFSGGGGGLYERYTVGTPAPSGGPAPRHGWAAILWRRLRWRWTDHDTSGWAQLRGCSWRTPHSRATAGFKSLLN